MEGLDKLQLGKLRNLQYITRNPEFKFIHTVYEDADGRVYKIEDGKLWIRVVEINRHPDEAYAPAWRSVVALDKLAEVTGQVSQSV
jgi:hypothetical protein